MKRREFITRLGGTALAGTQGLQELGRWAQRADRLSLCRGDERKARAYGIALIALAPDVVFAVGNSLMALLLQVSCTVPIVFTVVPGNTGELEAG